MQFENSSIVNVLYGARLHDGSVVGPFTAKRHSLLAFGSNLKTTLCMGVL